MRRRALMLLFAIIAAVTCVTITVTAMMGAEFEEPEDIAAKILHLKIHQLLPEFITNIMALLLPLIIGVIVGYLVGDKL